MILSLFRKDPEKETAEALFAAAAEQARLTDFYTKLGVEDSVEGRFELLILHVYLVLRRLKTIGAGNSRLSQKLLDALFANLDGALREMGVGDLSVSRKIRAMAEAFYGRVGAYEAAASATEDADLAAALGRNVYGDPSAANATALARYVRRAAKALDEQPAARLQAGIARFATPLDGESAEERRA